MSLSGKRVEVVGAGIEGLATALVCAQEGARVTVVGAGTEGETTSYGAAAFWRPYFVPGTPEDDIARWSGMTMALFRELLDSGLGELCGLHYIRGTELYTTPVPVPEWTKYAIDLEVLKKSDLVGKFGGHYTGALRFTSVVSDPSFFMPWLRTHLSERGATFERRWVSSLEEEATSGRWDVVINCTGLGARELARDADVIPVRGQVIKTYAPAVREWVVDIDGPNACGYVLPRSSGLCVMGGTHQDNDWRQEDSEADLRDIRSHCYALMPQLRGGREVGTWAGLRPARTSGVRVAVEGGDGGAVIVHNYGHGGSGWTLFWGTAHDAMRLAAHRVAGRTGSPQLSEKVVRVPALRSRL